ncbi:MAG: hypothetical protein ACI9LM_003004 [Alteromonadaceae bacterium]
MLRRSKYPISALLSIPIARYYSLKRLALEHLLSLIIDHYFNSLGIGSITAIALKSKRYYQVIFDKVHEYVVEK